MDSTLFLDLLKGGAKPDFAAKTFARSLAQHCGENDELPWLAANFVNDLFRAINFTKLEISPQHVQDRLKSFNWPVNEMQRYVFFYEKTSFKQIEKFLYKLCENIKILIEESGHTKSTNDTQSTTCSSTGSSLMHWFLQLIATWQDTCQKMRNQKITIYFNEPIARIDYQLLRGFQILRKSYRDDFPILDSVCGQLLKSVLLGILYPQTHIFMIPGIIKMLHDDFHLFYRQYNTTANFYETILTANLPASFHRDIFKSLFQLLNTYCLNYEKFNAETVEKRQRSLDVSNFMIDSKMLDIYYHYLTNESYALVLGSLLDFLILLQSKLADTGIFLDSFMEAVLFWVLGGNDKVGDMSAKFYITVMKRRADNEFICNHCIQYYFANKNTPDYLLPYIRRLWKYFGTVQNVDTFVNLFTNSDKENEKYRIWGAHFLCAFVQYMLEDYATNRSIIIELLQKIIQLLQSMKCLITQSVLLDIFDILDKFDVPDKQTDFKKVFQLFESCAEEKLMSLEDWQYPLLKKWFQRFEQILKYSANSNRLQEVAYSVTEQCTDTIQKLNARIQALNFNEIQKYSCALQKICIMSKYQKINSDTEILNILRKNLITEAEPSGHSVFHKHADKNKILIDAYALELYARCLVQVFDVKDAKSLAWTTKKARELENFLKAWLRNDKILKSQPIVRIKTYFNCLVGLYFTFGSTQKDDILYLTASTYDLLVRTLLYTLFKPAGRKVSFNEYVEHTEVHPLRSQLYGQSMINILSELHSAPFVEINSYNIWQICLYYSLPTAANFKSTLHDLLLNLVQNGFNVYKRVIPIVVYNLYTQQPPLNEKSIVKAITAHKSFIDNLEIEDRSRLNCHVIFEVINMLKDAFKIRTIPGNRLEPLKHLHIFVKNLNLSSEIENELRNELAALRRGSLRHIERKTLSEFLNIFKQSDAEQAETPSTPRAANF